MTLFIRQAKEERKKQNLKQLVFVDGLNLVGDFFPRDNCDFWQYNQGVARFQKFAHAARKSDYELEFFIDYLHKTQNVYKKWTLRREEDIKNMELTRTPGIHTILGQLCKEEGFKVHYSDTDGDNTIATCAQHFGADILSRDRDYLRYKGASYKIFSNYQIKKNKLCLIERNLLFTIDKTIEEPRDLLIELPKTHSHTPFKEKIVRLKTNYIGASTPLNKYFGNLNDKTKKLRSHFYHQLGIEFKVKEIYPYWSIEEHNVLWTDHTIKPKDRGMRLMNFLKIQYLMFCLTQLTK
eukprot:403332194